MNPVKLIFACSLILMPLCGTAQYMPFIDFSQWFLTEVNPQGSSFDWYQTGKDSTINGREYYQALADYDPLPIWLREEADSQRVYVTAPWDGWQDRLLYDFSLAEGDTTTLIFRQGGALRFVVDQIDAVNSTQGFIPRLNLLNIDGGLPATLQWTPGVGGFTHPFYLDFPITTDTTFMLICNYHDGTKLWDDGFGNCPGIPPPLETGEGESEMGPRVALTENHFSVEAPIGKPWRVRVVDLRGNLLVEHDLLGGRKYQMGEGWKRGLYLVQVWSGNRSKSYKWLRI